MRFAAARARRRHSARTFSASTEPHLGEFDRPAAARPRADPARGVRRPRRADRRRPRLLRPLLPVLAERAAPGGGRSCSLWPTSYSTSRPSRKTPGTSRSGARSPRPACGVSSEKGTRRARGGEAMKHWLMKSEPDDLRHRRPRQEPAENHALGRRAQLPGARIHARPDERRRPRVLLPLELRGARDRRHREDRETRATRITRRSTRKTNTTTRTAIPKNPRWYMVDVRFQRKLAKPITLATLRKHSNGALHRARALATRQPTFDHAGERRTLEIHSLARVASVRVALACRSSRELQNVQRITLSVRIVATKMRKNS